MNSAQSCTLERGLKGVCEVARIVTVLLVLVLVVINVSVTDL